MENNENQLKKILVLCTGNSCRSQIAEGYLRHFSQGRAEIYSAGIETHGVNPMAIKVLKEDGLDISSHTSNHIDEYDQLSFDTVITVCDHAKEQCPYFPAITNQLHHNFTDPAKVKGTEDEVLNSFRSVRDEIKAYCQQFSKTNFD